MFFIACGALAGALDCVCGNRLGIGEKFEEGFLCLGRAALNMVGMICIAPAVGMFLKPYLVPIYRFLGADPAMFGSLFANNMGGYSLAMTLAETKEVGAFSGLIVSSMLGASIMYTIPVGMAMIREEDRRFFGKGVLLGLIPIPIGALVGGRMMGLSFETILHNTIPTAFVSISLLLGFQWFQDRLLDGFMQFAKGIKWLGTISLGIAAFSSITGIAIIPGMADIEEGMKVIGEMGVIQLGSLPLAALFVMICKYPLEQVGKKININAAAMGSLPVSCVNVLSSFLMIKDMNSKGMILASAWLANTICVFTAHMSYTEAMMPQMVPPVIAAKFVSGFLAIILVLLVERTKKYKLEN